MNYMKKKITKKELEQRISNIIANSNDNEVAHSDEDALHLKLIYQFCPTWVIKKIKKLNKADFARWYA